MTAQPACFQRLDEILSALRSMTSTRLDRAAVEKLFRVCQPGVQLVNPWHRLWLW